MSLSQKTCTPCQGGVEPLTEAEAKELLQKTSDWQLKEGGKKLYREFEFDNFQKALDFTNKVGELAEAEQHHPDIQLGWGYVNITIFTHKIDGLHENDFILASKVDEVFSAEVVIDH